jgi:hypothetical protein
MSIMSQISQSFSVINANTSRTDSNLGYSRKIRFYFFDLIKDLRGFLCYQDAQKSVESALCN